MIGRGRGEKRKWIGSSRVNRVGSGKDTVKEWMLKESQGERKGEKKALNKKIDFTM